MPYKNTEEYADSRESVDTSNTASRRARVLYSDTDSARRRIMGLPEPSSEQNINHLFEEELRIRQPGQDDVPPLPDSYYGYQGPDATAPAHDGSSRAPESTRGLGITRNVQNFFGTGPSRDQEEHKLQSMERGISTQDHSRNDGFEDVTGHGTSEHLDFLVGISPAC